METPPNTNSSDEFCTIKIAFPIKSDDQAIAKKKEIAALLADIQDVRIQFSIMNIPGAPPPPVPHG